MRFPFERNDESSSAWYRSGRVLAVCLGCVLLLGLLGLGKLLLPSHRAQPEVQPPAVGEVPQEAAPIGAPQPAHSKASHKLAFLVGVKEYNHVELKNLDFPENDVDELGQVLKAQGFQVIVLTTARGKKDETLVPSAENIRRQLTSLLRGATKRDIIVIGLAGHGLQPLGSDESYFCPMDANPVIENERPAEPERLISLGELLV